MSGRHGRSRNFRESMLGRSSSYVIARVLPVVATCSARALDADDQNDSGCARMRSRTRLPETIIILRGGCPLAPECIVEVPILNDETRSLVVKSRDGR